MAEYTALLRSQAAPLLEHHPHLDHEWRDDGQTLALIVPRRSPHSFDVSLAATAQGVQVAVSTESGGMHVPFDPRDYESADALIGHALGLVRDLLSTDMRLRVLEAGGTPYRWYLESRDGTGWRTENTMGLLVWPFWRPRAERIFQNDALSRRGH